MLYPLHWPLSWLRPEQALIWSALLHVWLAAGFTYTFARRSLRLSRLAAWLAGLIFGMGGFTLARVENINQLNALAWLPALLWLYDETARAAADDRASAGARRWPSPSRCNCWPGTRRRRSSTWSGWGCGRGGRWLWVRGRGDGNEETGRHGDSGEGTNRLRAGATTCCRCWPSFRRFCSPRRNCCPRWN